MFFRGLGVCLGGRSRINTCMKYEFRLYNEVLMEDAVADLEKALTLDYPWRRGGEPLAYIFRRFENMAAGTWDIIIAHKRDVEMILTATAGKPTHVTYSVVGAKVANSDKKPELNDANGKFQVTGRFVASSFYFNMDDLYRDHLGDLM